MRIAVDPRAHARRVRTPRTASLWRRPAGVPSTPWSPPPDNHQASPEVDAIVVSYRSAATLRGCVEPLARHRGRAGDRRGQRLAGRQSSRRSPTCRVELVRSERNGGFSYGCNLGAARGRAPYLLFLNPDARIGADGRSSRCCRCSGTTRARRWSARGSSTTTASSPGACGASPATARRSRRRSSRIACCRSAAWTDELIRDPAVYDAPGTPDWLSGACMLVRRTAFEEVGGFDEGFFLYCEDTDLCRRLWDAGHVIRYVPDARCRAHRRGILRGRRDPARSPLAAGCSMRASTCAPRARAWRRSA